MSTNYNRRRGAKSYRPRTKRMCAANVRDPHTGKGCPRFASVNRYCEEHQTCRPAEAASA